MWTKKSLMWEKECEVFHLDTGLLIWPNMSYVDFCSKIDLDKLLFDWAPVGFA